MGNIRLHATKGVNPRMTVCPRCGADDGIALLGANEGIYKCPVCDKKIIGGPDCPEHGRIGVRIGTLGEHDKLPGNLCPSCVAELEEHKKLVAEGGVYWKCVKGHSGVVLAHAGLAKQVREQMGIPAPGPCGIEFTEETCPECHPELVGGQNGV